MLRETKGQEKALLGSKMHTEGTHVELDSACARRSIGVGHSAGHSDWSPRTCGVGGHRLGDAGISWADCERRGP